MKITRLVIFSLTGLVAFVTTVLLACLLYIHFNRDEFIRYFLSRINENLNTPVTVAAVDISYWEEFPKVSIVLEGVEAGTDQQKLMEVERLSFSFGLWHFLSRNYAINQLTLHGAKLNLVISSTGHRNFDIVKNGDAGTAGEVSLGRVKIINSHITFDDQKNRFNTRWKIDNASLEIESLADPVLLSASFSGTNERTVYQGFSYLEAEQLAVKLEDVLLTAGDLRSVKSWELTASKHQLKGSMSTNPNDELSMEWQGSTHSLRQLLANIPAGWPSEWPSYKLEGNASFSGHYLATKTNPQLVVNFRGSGLSFRYPSRELSFSDFTAEGKLITNLLASGSSLYLSSLQGRMNDFGIKGKATLVNLQSMETRAELEGELSLALFEQMMPGWGIRSRSGHIDYALAFDGILDEKASAGWLIDGEASLRDATFDWNNYTLPLQKWSGTFLFNDRDVAVTEAEGWLGSSQLKVSGLLRNFHFFYEPKTHLLLIEGKLRASVLNLNELLATQSSQDGKAGYSFGISPRLQLFLEAEADRILLDRFMGTAARAKVRISDRTLHVGQLSFQSMGGKINLSGWMADEADGMLQSSFSGKLSSLHIDSVFYVFHDFDQTWLQSKHLKGQIDADFDVNMGLWTSLKFVPERFKARIDARGVNGELIRFEPLQELSRLVDDEKLAHLTFGELHNQFLIENKRIIIPSMEIRSNVSDIVLSGSHTFDQVIDYRLKVPVFNKSRKRDRDEAFGAIEEDPRGNVYAHVKITGTTDNYKVAYDTKSAARTVIDGLKKEGRELRQEIRKEPAKKPKTLQLKEDEYFEFEADTLPSRSGS